MEPVTSMEIETIKSVIDDFINKGEFKYAFDAIVQYDDMLPNDSATLCMKSTVAALNENWVLAKEFLNKAIISNPMTLEYIYNLSVIMSEMGNIRDAKFYLEKIIPFESNEKRKEEMIQQYSSLEYKCQIENVKTQEKQEFLDILVHYLTSSLLNNYLFNVDIELLQYMNIPLNNMIVVDCIEERKNILDNISGLSLLFDKLNDQHSKELLINLLAYRVLGNTKIKLPLNNDDYWKGRSSIKEMISTDEFIISPFHNWKLKKYNLDKIGYPIELFYNPMGLSATFIDKQYEYNNGEKKIKVEKESIVIDCGGCWGDTALYFANEVGENGKVYTMEFIPSNLEIMERNLDLNPKLKGRISVITNPVWNKSDDQLYFIDQGPASIVTEIQNSSVKVDTLSIDDLVEREKIRKVDFIKMDIEGAELPALTGAYKTIKDFRPILAIAVYHNINDFYDVANFIDNLDLNYSYYLGHYTIYAQETVLFAVPNE